MAHLHALRAASTPITMLTAYDYVNARACDAYGADIAQVCVGYDSITALSLDEHLRGARAPPRRRPPFRDIRIRPRRHRPSAPLSA